MSDVERNVVERMIARRVKAIILDTFAVKNGTPRTLLGDVNPGWLVERANNAATALLGDDFIHVTSRVPEGSHE